MKRQSTSRSSKVSSHDDGDGHTERKDKSGIYYDRDSGRVGYGNKYGERSFNQRPVDAFPIKDKCGSIDQETSRSNSRSPGTKD